MPTTNRMEIVISIQICPILWMNINYKENGGKKSFCYKQKNQYRGSQCGEHDFSAHNEKYGDYNEYRSLSYFTDEH